ncbi:Fungus-induced-related protein 15 [Caenorhabditis elegans]|uniref:Fungus-induced-related protein 15 n=1 Tax=Caenorhabditis elegans TaxID=6239 RepID=FIR15_CAEEL|nr:Fungus-induced-related protein 15 [Caenorhabditis elegans]Q19408.2 RecName: Full=Fungus-induced-related protein 15; Flags: Precursor [Caenorhabditis elegans]CAA93406.2 Fungus-induced-related protein 15 [Caenorhabditis elegans]|eukprot:NP_502019.2 Fungus-induced-related protein 15 [Caenorhabditis elegans]
MNFYSLFVFIALIFSFNVVHGHRCHRGGNGGYGGGSGEVVVIGAEKPKDK